MTLLVVSLALFAALLLRLAWGYLFGTRQRKHHDPNPLGRRF